ncbi:hypothetical protein [Providencia stuartii]|uniref:Uncharacterized protein n=1 Tax=Providencia stuartii TaxID=588 RepID=A0A1S1HLF0_PROST|nr:hypothetical protein [Providencia stuartii]OHT22867.1 hypothetical protein A3Q29_21645 [Providencia stuartii]
MKHINEYGFVDNYSRPYFILKALLLCDELHEKKDLFTEEVIVLNSTVSLALLTRIASSCALASGFPNAESIAEQLYHWPITLQEVDELMMRPLSEHLSIQVTSND